MGNQLKNAGLLDGSAGWTGLSGAVLSVDEAVVGGPGRAVLVATRNVAVGQTVEAASSGLAVTAGQVVEAFASVGGSGPGAVALKLEILSAGGARLAITDVPLQRASVGTPRRGLAASFSRFWGLAPASATGTARLVGVYTSTVAAPQQAYLMKPYLAAPGSRVPGVWDPGSHDNPDLQLPVWPSGLPPMLEESSIEPFANRRAFAGDVGLPISERTYRGMHYALRARLRLTPEEADTLDQFYETTPGPFFFLRPDTDQLCMAEWLADGAPKPVDLSGVKFVRDVGLHVWAA